MIQFLYALARFFNGINALFSGRVGQRAVRRSAHKQVGRWLK